MGMGPAIMRWLCACALLLAARASFVLSPPPPRAALGAAPPPAQPPARALVEGFTAFAYPALEQVEARVAELAAAHPTLVRTWTAQQAYGTQAGQCHLMSGGKATPTVCRHTFVKLTNFSSGGEAWAAQSPALRDRPQIFFSGNLHGDEWVGPATLLQLVELLLACGADAEAPCFNPWLARLLNTRTLVFLIVSNPAGYSAQPPKREDAGVDPNRDFPYATDSCLLSSTAQAINSAWREHIFQLGITFHGGMESITYEWGSPAQPGPSLSMSPDDAGQADLASVLRDVAGPLNSHQYIVGRTNDVVYAVEGGMEDWAYAGACCARAVGRARPALSLFSPFRQASPLPFLPSAPLSCPPPCPCHPPPTPPQAPGAQRPPSARATQLPPPMTPPPSAQSTSWWSRMS